MKEYLKLAIKVVNFDSTQDVLAFSNLNVFDNLGAAGDDWSGEWGVN